MPFKHACFISYRHHEQSELAERFISDLCRAVLNELIPLLDASLYLLREHLYIDREGLRGAELYNPSLADALCKSACMIVVYTPTYFSPAHLYCTREYLAMEKLEKARLARVSDLHGHDKGLIIPIILRGETSLPATIRAHRHYYTFERFSLAGRVLARNRQFEGSIRQIASVIHERMQMLAPLADELTCDCESFTLPTQEEARHWLENVIPSTIPFPLR
jgi:hypothetical protein